MRKLLKIFFILLLIIILLIIAVVVFFEKLPYRAFIEEKIISTAHDQGVEVKNIEIEKISKTLSEITNLKIGSGEGDGLSISSIEAQYSWKELLEGVVEKISIDNIEVNLTKNSQGQWHLRGVASKGDTHQDGEYNKSINYSEQLNKLAGYSKFIPHEFAVNNSIFSIKDEALNLETKFDFNLTKKEEPSKASVNLQLQEFAFNLDKAKLSAEKIEAAGSLRLSNSDFKQFTGSIHIPSLLLDIADVNIPVLEAKIMYKLQADEIYFDFDISGPEKKYVFQASFKAPLNNMAQAVIEVQKAQFKWGGGVIAIENQKFPVVLKKPVKLNISIKDVGVADLMDLISNGRVYGTGKVSGSVPVIYNPYGHIGLADGVIRAKENGTIIVSPELLPGENDQVKIARKTLENFNYNNLKISVLSEGEKGKEKSVVKMYVAGKNPDANNGREVILNVNVSGDIIPLIQKSLIPFDDFKKLINTEN